MWLVLAKSPRTRLKGHCEEGGGRHEALDAGERGSEEMEQRRGVVDARGDEVARAEE